MKRNDKIYMKMPSDLREYYEKRRKGLIEARPYDSWGPETPKETAKWEQWWAPIQHTFHPIDWNSGFTGRGVAKTKEAMEVPGLVGPKDETIPISEEGSKSTKRERRLTNVAKNIYKRARASLAHIEKRGLARGRVESDDEIIDVMGGGFDRLPLPENNDPAVHRGDPPSFLQTNGLDAHNRRRNIFHLPTWCSTNRHL